MIIGKANKVHSIHIKCVTLVDWSGKPNAKLTFSLHALSDEVNHTTEEYCIEAQESQRGANMKLLLKPDKT